MQAARCYECPACGGLVREAARVCGYCRSPIATTRCHNCFTMNIPEAQHCMSCGAELGLEPIEVSDGAETNCPRCKHRQLDSFGNQDGTILDCGGCGGQFVSREVLASMIRRHQGVVHNKMVRLRPANPLQESVTYIPCPFCDELMLRRNFGRVSGIVVDTCAKHGTWFDVGELSRVLSFVSAGGLNSSTEAGVDDQRHSYPTIVRAGGTGCGGDFTFDPLDVEVTWADIKRALREFVQAIVSPGRR